MTAEELNALAERVEGLTGKTYGPDSPYRALYHDIAIALGWTHERRKGDARPYYRPPTEEPWERKDSPPQWLESLDAAMTLVPEDFAATVCQFSNGRGKAIIWIGSWIQSHERPSAGIFAATPALALTAAALRALAETKGE